VKPFTLDAFYTFCECVAVAKENGRMLRAPFEAACSILLLGSSAEAQLFADSGKLAKDVLLAPEEEAKAAAAFKGRVDFLSIAFAKRGQELTASAPDLTGTLAVKTPKASRRKAQ
jgi:hypothetical protein